jgi:hypothetical protein
MRNLVWVGAGLVCLALATPAWAQRSAFETINPREITFKPISTTQNLAAPIAAQQSSSFSLRNFMPKMSLAGFLSKPKPIVSPLLPVTTIPTTSVKSSARPQAPIIRHTNPNDG